MHCWKIISETAAQVLQRVDDHHAVFPDRLHHQLHQVLGKSHAAAGVGLERPEAVQEDRGAAAGRTPASAEAAAVSGCAFTPLRPGLQASRLEFPSGRASRRQAPCAGIRPASLFAGIQPLPGGTYYVGFMNHSEGIFHNNKVFSRFN